MTAYSSVSWYIQMGTETSCPNNNQRHGDHYDVTIGVANLPIGIYFITVRSNESSVITEVEKLF